MYKLLLIGFLSLYIGKLQAQIYEGFIPEDEAYDAFPLFDSLPGEKDIPLVPYISLKAYCPTPGDQEETGACVAWAVGYGALTISRAIEQKITNRETIDKMAHSPSFVFNQLKKKCNTGITFGDVFRFMHTQGDCLNSTFPWSETFCAGKPGSREQQEAENFRIGSCARIFDRNDKPEDKIIKIRQALASNVPVIIGIALTPDFWNIERRQDTIWAPLPNEAEIGNHAMVIVGYDDRSTTFELMNSYGDKWANNGFIRIGYNDLARLVRYGFRIYLNERRFWDLDWEKLELMFGAGKKQAVRATVEKCQFTETGYVCLAQTALFKPMDNQYEFEKNTWKQDDRYRLVLTNAPDSSSVYVCSLDASGRINLLHTSIFRPQNENAELLVPSGRNTSIRFDIPGREYICIFISDRDIPSFGEQLLLLNKTSGSVLTRLREIFPEIILPADQVLYRHDSPTVGWYLLPGQTGFVIPLVISFEVR